MLGVFLLAATATFADPVCDAASGRTAQQMFEHARDVWSASQYPRELYFSVAIHADANGKPRSVRYTGHAEPNSGAVAIHRFSDEETRDPYVPHGINVAVSVTIGILPAYHKVLTAPIPTFDLLGIPRLSPTYSFGMRRTAAHAGTADAMLPPTSPEAALKTIGGTSTRIRDYDVACGGLERSGDSAPVMRLTLRPRHDPGRLRLRTVWLDPDSFAVSKIETFGNFTRDAPVAVPWIITFVMRDGMPYITSERAQASMRINGTLLDNVELEFLPSDPPPDAASRLLFHLRADADELREPDSDI